jgi:acetoin utilization protein AcuB
MRIGLIMTSNVVTLGPDEHIDDAAKKMLSHRIGGMPVVSDGAVVGMLTESDLFRAFVRMASASDVLRIRIWREKHRELAPDPVMLATRLGFKVRGFLMHEKPGGEEFAVLRVQGAEKERLLELLGCSGYTVVEVTDLRDPSTHKPAA